MQDILSDARSEIFGDDFHAMVSSLAFVDIQHRDWVLFLEMELLHGDFLGLNLFVLTTGPTTRLVQMTSHKSIWKIQTSAYYSIQVKLY